MSCTLKEAALAFLAGILICVLVHQPPAVLPTDSLRARVPEGWLEPAALSLRDAPVRELRRLPRIGQQRALDLVRWRWEHGPEVGLEDLEAIPGIGPRTVEDLESVLQPR